MKTISSDEWFIKLSTFNGICITHRIHNGIYFKPSLNSTKHSLFLKNKTFCRYPIWLWCREEIDGHSKETFISTENSMHCCSVGVTFSFSKTRPIIRVNNRMFGGLKKNKKSWINWRKNGKFSLNTLALSIISFYIDLYAIQPHLTKLACWASSNLMHTGHVHRSIGFSRQYLWNERQHFLQTVRMFTLIWHFQQNLSWLSL